MKNFTSIAELDNSVINNLIDTGLSFKDGSRNIPQFKDTNFVTLFLEPSTRTKSSFEFAIHRVGANKVDIDASKSSLLKGESLLDTLLTLKALEVDGVIIRSEQEKYYQGIEVNDFSIINAGDGANEHPSQVLLDLMTIKEHKQKLDSLKVLIMGDIKHSRVAKNNYDVMTKLGMNVKFFAPHFFKAEGYPYIDSLENEINEFDVVMVLRNQLERHASKEDKLQETYLEKYGLSHRLFKMLNDDAIVLHPGPFNRDVEIASSILEEDNIKILNQVNNGLYARIAILDYVMEGYE